MIADELPKRLRKLRQQRRLQDVAKEIGISRASLGYYENGQRSPDAGVIYKLAKFYGVSADYILGLSNDKIVNKERVMKTVIVTDKETREVIACIPEYGEAICRKDVSVSVFDGTEPIFLESENGIKLSTNKFLINSEDI